MSIISISANRGRDSIDRRVQKRSMDGTSPIVELVRFQERKVPVLVEEKYWYSGWSLFIFYFIIQTVCV
jgi:hypothetical protein